MHGNHTKTAPDALLPHMVMMCIACAAAAYAQLELRASLVQVYGPSVTAAVSTSSGAALYAR